MKPAELTVDEARVLPRFRLIEAQASVFRTEYNRARAAGITPTAPSRHAVPNPGDLRGIPCIAPGVSGVSPGTEPLAATIRSLDRQPFFKP
jgi:hypothetical protein